MKRLLLAAATAAGGFACLGGTAFAAPTHAPKAQVISVNCGGGDFLAVVPPGSQSDNGKSLTPAFPLSGGGVLVPTSITFAQAPIPGISRAANNPNATDLTCNSDAFGGIIVTGFNAPNTVGNR